MNFDSFIMYQKKSPFESQHTFTRRYRDENKITWQAVFNNIFMTCLNVLAFDEKRIPLFMLLLTSVKT